jgi:hypothetical protein
MTLFYYDVERSPRELQRPGGGAIAQIEEDK